MVQTKFPDIDQIPRLSTSGINFKKKKIMEFIYNSMTYGIPVSMLQLCHTEMQSNQSMSNCNPKPYLGGVVLTEKGLKVPLGLKGFGFLYGMLSSYQNNRVSFAHFSTSHGMFFINTQPFFFFFLNSERKVASP